MRLKSIFLNSVIGFTALFLGLGFVSAWRFIMPIAINYEEVKAVNDKPEPVKVSKLMPEPPAAETTKEKPAINGVENEFDAVTEIDGYYSIIGDLPVGFKNFTLMEIWTWKFDEKTGQFVPTPPTGEFAASSRFDFDRIFIANKILAFSTTKIKGISYKFRGKYTLKKGVYDSREETLILSGKLAKFKNGKKIAEATVDFYWTPGC